jgi:hypothetical protein
MEGSRSNGAAPESRAPLPPAAAKVLVDILAHGLGAMERRCLEQGVQVQDIIDCLLNHCASLVAIVEPGGMRAELVRSIIDSVPTLVREHVAARQRTPGGVFLPPGAARAMRAGAG